MDEKILQTSWDKPKFLENTDPSYITMMGSRAYGTETLESDYDFYGFVVPPPEFIFPHLKGKIHGFGDRHNYFDQYQAQHQQHPVYGIVDVTIYNVVKYFQLVMAGNPNIVDSLFTPTTSVKTMDSIGKMVKDNRHIFLSEKMYHTFKGMAWSHASRLKKGIPKEGRKKYEEKYSYDVKDAYHTIRILLQIKDVLMFGDLDLQKHKAYLNYIRQGYYSLEYILTEFELLMKEIEEIVADGSVVPYSPDQDKILALLVNCLEEKYGSLSHFGFGHLLF